ncbi:hypothetical protein GWK47_009257 [Chionoecetes opilio]|uniref:Uncharacterized protein n=1 Tax=Chionoecetes opilio TaxID=41210 RepID=A0A8J4Y3K5_CHIOP|nr:hypothetical protein GWK47_009257 [Chionoecetes opilio]
MLAHLLLTRIRSHLLKHQRPQQSGFTPAAGSEPSVNQKLFLVVSVALATVCFFTNVLQVAVFARPSAMRCVKGVLLLSQAVSGLVATFVVAFPIHVISSRGGE